MNRRAFFERNLVQERKQYMSMYKANSFGERDRVKNSNSAKENRKKRRDEEISKRRMPLCTIETKNITVNNQIEEKSKDVTTTKDKAGDRRYQQLLKWREEKAKRIEQQNAKKKNVFAVRHVQYSGHPGSVLVNDAHCLAINNGTGIKKPVKHGLKSKEDPPKEVMQTKRVTRSQTRKQTEAKQSTSKLQGVVTRSKMGQKETKRQGTVASTNAKVRKNSNNKEEKDSGAVVESTKNKLCNLESTVPTKQEIVVTSEPVAEPATSFAPRNFQFQPPTGVGSFHYLAENFTFEPHMTSLSHEVADSFVFGAMPAQATTPPQADTAAVKFQAPGTPLNEDSGNWETLGGDANVADVEMAPATDPVSTESTVTVQENEAAAKFRSLVESVTEKLQELCAVWEKEKNNAEGELPEEVQGKIRTVVGQVQLLVTKKFKQFKELIDMSEDPNAEHKTLESDLQGFWDMMYFQVEEIEGKFQELDKLKLTNWIEPKKEVKKPVKKRIKSSSTATKSTSTKSVAKNQSRTDFKKLRSQMKAKLLQQQQNSGEDVPVTVYLSPLQKARLLEIEKQPDDPVKKNLLLDSIYLQPSEASGTPPCDRSQVTSKLTEAASDSSNLIFFTPVRPSRSQLVTPTPTKLTTTPMPQSCPFSQPKGPPPRTPREDEQRDLLCGSIRKVAQITPSKKQEAYFGDDLVFSPVRRSARIEQSPATGLPSSQKVVSSFSELLLDDITDYGYQPNKALLNFDK